MFLILFTNGVKYIFGVYRYAKYYLIEKLERDAKLI